MELRVENEAEWYCFAFTYMWQLSLNCNTTTAKTFFYNVMLKCFQNHCHFLKSQKQTKAFFKVSRRFFVVLNWSTNSWRGIKNLFRSRERASKKILWKRPRKWQAKVEPNKTETRQRRKCQDPLSHNYTDSGRSKYLQRRHGLWKHEKEY